MKKSALAVAVLLALAGGGFWILEGKELDPRILRGPEGSERGSDVAGPWLVFDKSGGFVGGLVRFEVDDDGATRVVRETAGKPRREHLQLSRADLDEIADLFAGAAWPSTNTSYDEPNMLVSDGYVYEITYDGVTVDAPDMRPAWLMRLASDLEDVVLGERGAG